jgi:hypothetical protein
MARRRLPGWVLGETVRREQRPRSKTPRFDHNSTAYCVYAGELNLGNVDLNWRPQVRVWGITPHKTQLPDAVDLDESPTRGLAPPRKSPPLLAVQTSLVRKMSPELVNLGTHTLKG